MINQSSILAVDQAKFSKSFCRPLYGSYCFDQIPGTVLKLLTGTSTECLPNDTYTMAQGEYEYVVLIFIDGFGWRFFEQFFQELPFLKRFENTGIASKITSLFPSTTAAHVTLMNTGLDPGQTGIYEWFMYEPTLNRIIAPLPFSFAGDHKLHSLSETSFKAENLLPFPTIYEEFSKKNIASFVYQHSSIASSAYSSNMHRGAQIVSYVHFEEALDNIVEKIKQPAKQPTYLFAYDAEIDSVGHRKGINGIEFSQTVSQFFSILESRLWTPLSKMKKKAALLLVADHGMTSVDPKRTFYLNKIIPSIVNHLKKGADGKPLAPAGSCRDFFLHIEDEEVEETKEILTRFLSDQAEVFLTKELIKERLFSRHPVSQRFLDRVGNLVILPKEDQAVWWFEKNRFAQNFHAAHGGLTRKEMETIFLFLPFGK